MADLIPHFLTPRDQNEIAGAKFRFRGVANGISQIIFCIFAGTTLSRRMVAAKSAAVFSKSTDDRYSVNAFLTLSLVASSTNTFLYELKMEMNFY